MEAGHQKDQLMIRSLEMLAPSPILQRDRRCLREEVSIKSPKYDKVWRASRWMNTATNWKDDTPYLHGARGSCTKDTPRSHPVYIVIWLSASFLISFNKLVNPSVSLSSVTHASILIEPKEVVMGTSDGSGVQVTVRLEIDV